MTDGLQFSLPLVHLAASQQEPEYSALSSREGKRGGGAEKEEINCQLCTTIEERREKRGAEEPEATNRLYEFMLSEFSLIKRKDFPVKRGYYATEQPLLY